MPPCNHSRRFPVASSSAWAIRSSWRQISATKTADPAKANQYGAVIPHFRAITPPMT